MFWHSREERFDCRINCRSFSLVQTISPKTKVLENFLFDSYVEPKVSSVLVSTRNAVNSNLIGFGLTVLPSDAHTRRQWVSDRHSKQKPYVYYHSMYIIINYTFAQLLAQRLIYCEDFVRCPLFWVPLKRLKSQDSRHYTVCAVPELRVWASEPSSAVFTALSLAGESTLLWAQCQTYFLVCCDIFFNREQYKWH